MKGSFEELNAKLEASTVGLTGISRKRVFGRNTFFVDGKLFALVWREGRIGLKLPDASTHAELAAVPGVTPWVAWGRPMNGWLLVPAAMHQASAELAGWVKRSSEAVRVAAPAPPHETVATRIEPLPSPPKISIRVSAPPPLPARARSVPSPAVPSRGPSHAPSNGAPAMPSMPVMLAASVNEAPAAAEFSFDEQPAAAEIVEAVQVAVETPPPPPPPADVTAGASQEEAFSFDAPEPAPVIDNVEAQEFDFGSEPEPAAAPVVEQDAGKKKKGGKSKKRTG